MLLYKSEYFVSLCICRWVGLLIEVEIRIENKNYFPSHSYFYAFMEFHVNVFAARCVGMSPSHSGSFYIFSDCRRIEVLNCYLSVFPENSGAKRVYANILKLCHDLNMFPVLPIS